VSYWCISGSGFRLTENVIQVGTFRNARLSCCFSNEGTLNSPRWHGVFMGSKSKKLWQCQSLCLGLEPPVGLMNILLTSVRKGPSFASRQLLLHIIRDPKESSAHYHRAGNASTYVCMYVCMYVCPSVTRFYHENQCEKRMDFRETRYDHASEFS
jgi:hypothetical protein